MNALKCALAVAVLALSANVAAQIVYVPDFPVKKAVSTANAETKAPATEEATQGATTAEKAA